MLIAIIAACTPFLIALIKTKGWNLSSTKGMAIYGTILTNVFLLGNMMNFFVMAMSEVAKGMSSV